MDSIGEIKIHHHRNVLTDQIKKIKEQQAWEIFNDMYMGSEPAEADFVEYTASKMESGEIQNIAFRLAIKAVNENFIIIFLTDEGTPLSESTDFIKWSDEYHGNKINE